MAPAKQVWIGISLGSLNSAVSVFNTSGAPELVANDDGERSIPSCVAYSSHNGELIIGTQAAQQTMSNPKGTLRGFRNILGRSMDHADVKEQQEEMAFTLEGHPDNAAQPSYRIEVMHEGSDDVTVRHIMPEHVTKEYIRHLVDIAKAYIRAEVVGAVISIPATFDETQKKSIRAAAAGAGVPQTQLVHEPVAAALAYHAVAPKDANEARLAARPDQRILVADLGGHSFNATVLSQNDGMWTIMASADDHDLGGTHFDDVLVDYIRAEFKRKYKTEIPAGNRRSMMKLRRSAEITKRALSRQDTAPCSVESAYDGLDFHGSINRGRFDAMAASLLQRCAQMVTGLLEKTGLKPEDVDQVLLVGGASQMPGFQQTMRNLFANIPELVVRADFNADEVIASGCAHQAALRMNMPETITAAHDNVASTKQKVVLEPISLKLADASLVILPRNAVVPAQREIELAVGDAKSALLTFVQGGQNLVDMVIPKVADGRIYVTALIDEQSKLHLKVTSGSTTVESAIA